jgi:hypothetical protein
MPMSRRTRTGLAMALSALALLGACSTGPLRPPVPIDQPNRAHSPEELRGYRVSDFRAPWPREERERYAREQATTRSALALPAGAARDAELGPALARVLLYGFEIESARAALLEALPRLAQQPPRAQLQWLHGAHALAPAEAAPLILGQLAGLNTAREFAAAAHTVLAGQPDALDAVALALGAAQARLPPVAGGEPRLIALEHRLAALRALRVGRPAPRPPLVDLLAAPFKPGVPVVYSVQRPGRLQFGLALVRGPDGRFVRSANGSFFNIPQLGRAKSGMPGSITLGNAPQGLMVVRGVVTAGGNPAIGPTPLLLSKVPVEATVAEFELRPGARGREGEARDDASKAERAEPWTEAAYTALLPPSWRGNAPFLEAWLAGRAGRDEMIAHGTTVNPAYERGRPHFPGTPSEGCLVAMEYWDPTTGALLHSDQLALVQAFAGAGQTLGYLVIVELAGEGDVSLAELVGDLVQAERRLATRPVP